MPIYAYRCERCGHSQDVIQKFSDAPLTVCPACGADAYRKQLTAPAFQLKGSGWYVTDFRDNGKAKAGKPAGDGDASKPADAAGAGASATDAKPAGTPASSGGDATPASGAKPASPSTD